MRSDNQFAPLLFISILSIVATIIFNIIIISQNNNLKLMFQYKNDQSSKQS